MNRKLISAILGLTLLLGFACQRTAEPFVVVTNSAALSYTNAAQVFYYTAIDTAQIYIYEGPSMSITKLTKNLITGDQGSNTNTIAVAPGDTAEITLLSHNTGDSAAFWTVIIDTFPVSVGAPASNSMSYVPGSETCAINGSTIADSISWCTDAAHTWSAWQTYSDTLSRTIGSNCTGIRWRWNRIPCDTESATLSWIRVKFQWLRNQN